MKKIVAIFLMVALAISVLTTLVACNPDLEVPPPQYVFGYTSVEGGEIQGVVNQEQRIAVFKGIPYAKAPVGDLRWRAPQPVEIGKVLWIAPCGAQMRFKAMQLCSTCGQKNSSRTPTQRTTVTALCTAKIV